MYVAIIPILSCNVYIGDKFLLQLSITPLKSVLNNEIDADLIETPNSHDTPIISKRFQI